MQILLILSLVIAVIIWTRRTRIRRDQGLLAAHVADAGGQFRSAVPVKTGHPFPDTGRGWWAWRIEYTQAGVERVAWALTTRDGLKEWRDS
jgi:hypothetical protein